MIKSHLLIKSKEAPKYPNMVFATIYGVIAMIETLNSVLNDSDISWYQNDNLTRTHHKMDISMHIYLVYHFYMIPYILQRKDQFDGFS